MAVHTDSQFMINCMTSWLKNWKKKDWKKSDGESVKNKEELIELDKATEGLAVKWVSKDKLGFSYYCKILEGVIKHMLDWIIIYVFAAYCNNSILRGYS